MGVKLFTRQIKKHARDFHLSTVMLVIWRVDCGVQVRFLMGGLISLFLVTVKDC